ncbi:hypothetical protein AVEN_246989-1 [Araneus ventricosus]|uniref:Uncharacterized protein n=1 Tax=Araneus ventricosus TaxID=182803 RepID=A0A4Y2RWD7_ARAVE|nr:hypothetical protein AVEN_246989-1 [Araneus ventricosus]
MFRADCSAQTGQLVSTVVEHGWSMRSCPPRIPTFYHLSACSAARSEVETSLSDKRTSVPNAVETKGEASYHEYRRSCFDAARRKSSRCDYAIGLSKI